MSEFSHYSKDGASTMVDVSNKNVTKRVAKAEGFVKMSANTVYMIKNSLLPKGNPFEIAKIAGIMGAKKTSDLIPMCHPLLLSYIDLEFYLDEEKSGVKITSEVVISGQTGVEMEALAAISVASLTVYDMCKAVDKNMVIEGISVVEKRGGKSDYKKQ